MKKNCLLFSSYPLFNWTGQVRARLLSRQDGKLFQTFLEARVALFIMWCSIQIIYFTICIYLLFLLAVYALTVLAKLNSVIAHIRITEFCKFSGNAKQINFPNWKHKFINGLNSTMGRRVVELGRAKHKLGNFSVSVKSVRVFFFRCGPTRAEV